MIPPGPNDSSLPPTSFLGRGQSPSVIRRAIDRRGLQRFLAGTSACALLAVTALFHTWVRTQVTEEGYRLSRLAHEQQELQRAKEKLTLQAAQLGNPVRIEELARTKLGMGPASTERTVVLLARTIPLERPGASGTALASRERRP